jgi:RsiW-degrading membrane proteinase PrsW (M82 family)
MVPSRPPVSSGLAVELCAVILAAAPVMVLLALFRRADALRPEPRGEVARALVLGALLAIPVFALEVLLKRLLGGAALAAGRFLDAYLVAALPEEAAKLAVVLAVPFRRKSFDEFSDGVLYTAAASLGFGLLENLLYVSGWFAMWFCALPGVRLLCAPGIASPSGTHHIVLGLVRALTAVPMHALAAGIMGYFVGRARFAELSLATHALHEVVDVVPAVVSRRTAWCVVGLTAAVTVHGTYDWAVYAFGAERLIFVALPALLGAAAWMQVRLVRHALELDEALLGPGRRSSLLLALHGQLPPTQPPRSASTSVP